MPDKRDYLVRTWSVPGERESVEVAYRQAMGMVKRVKKNAGRTSENHPSAKRVKREVQAVNDWLTVMQSREWLSSQYVVGPIQTSRTPRGDENAQANVDDGGANEAPPHDDFGYDDFGYDDYGGGHDVNNENAPPNIDGGHANTGDLGDNGDTLPSSLPEESRTAGLIGFQSPR